MTMNENHSKSNCVTICLSLCREYELKIDTKGTRQVAQTSLCFCSRVKGGGGGFKQLLHKRDVFLFVQG